jgi:hypothetical protein
MNLAQFIRYHKLAHQVCTINVCVGDKLIKDALVHDDTDINQLSIYLPDEPEEVIIEVLGPKNPRLNVVLFNGYTASVYLH